MAVLEKGMAAPDFELEDADGKVWRLADLRGRKAIVYFYPIDDTPGCTVEACDFRDAQGAFAEADYVTLGISPQDAESHKAFATKYDLNYPLLVDSDNAIARKYGVWEDRGEYQGIPVLTKRSTFVIDEDGNITEALYGVNAQGHVEFLRSELGV